MKFLNRKTVYDRNSSYKNSQSIYKNSQSIKMCVYILDTSNVSPIQQLDPMCRPLSTVDDLENWQPAGHVSCRKRYTEDRQCPSRLRPNVLLCHDMMGGYVDSDRYVQGSLTNDGYRFWHWWQLDVFVYFSHELITIPPVCWIDAGHTHLTAVLGTFIVEWDAGSKQLQYILQSEDIFRRVADKLVDICQFYGFDGWLLNIECALQTEEVVMLKSFIRYLVSKMHSRLPNSIVLWYDSVIETGQLKWQNELNDQNKEFFNECDGIFINYGWRQDNLAASKHEAQLSGRQFDVYVGVDVFGRGCLGGGGFNTKEAMEAIGQFDLSAAVFAPGWVFENKDLLREEFVENESKFWKLIQDYCLRKPVVQLPFTTTFCRGWGVRYYLFGHTLLDHPWTNLSLQQLQPTSMDCLGDCSVEWTTQNAFKGGQCLRLSTTSSGTVRLFDVDETCIITDDLYVSFSYKEDCAQHLEGAGDISLVMTLRPASDDDSGEPKSNIVHLVGPDQQKTVGTDVCLVSSCDSSRAGHHGWITREYRLTELRNSRLSHVSVTIETRDSPRAAILLGELKVQTCEQTELILPDKLVGNLSDESSSAAVEPSPAAVDSSPVNNDLSAGSIKDSPGSVESVDPSPCGINSCTVNVDRPKILTWAEPEALRDLVSHYVVYQSPSDCRNHCTNLPSPFATAMTAQPEPSAKLSSLSFQPSVCDLESSGACVSCAANKFAEISDVPCVDTSSEGYWRCIGLTPSNCFRITTPNTGLSKFAVLPVSQNNTRLYLVEIVKYIS